MKNFYSFKKLVILLLLIIKSTFTYVYCVNFNSFNQNSNTNQGSDTVRPSVMLDTLYAKPGDTVIMHLTVSKFNNIVSFKYLIQYDTTVLRFKGIVNINSNINGLSYSQTHDSLNIVWSAQNSNSLNIDSNKICDISFIYNGGSTSLSFLPASNVIDNNSNYLDAKYKSGLMGGCTPPTGNCNISPVNPSKYVGDKIIFQASGITNGNSKSYYNWYQGGILRLSSTNVYYNINYITSSDAGIYQCIVTSCNAAISSNTSTLTVNTSTIIITQQPQGGIVNPGYPFTFTIAATETGSGTLSYQWNKNGITISNATLTSFIISSVANSDAADYSCVVSDGSCNATSAVATLAVFNATGCTTPYSASDQLIQSLYTGSGSSYSSIYSRTDWLNCFLNGKEINADRPVTDWQSLTPIAIDGTGDALLDISYSWSASQLIISNYYASPPTDYTYTVSPTDAITINIKGVDNNPSHNNNYINIDITIGTTPYTIYSVFNFNNSIITQNASASPEHGQCIYIHPYDELTGYNLSNVTVNIESLNLQINGNNNHNSSIDVRGCENINIRDSYLSGFFNSTKYLIDVFACTNIFIDKVEIQGVQGVLGKAGGGMRLNGNAANSGFYQIPNGCSKAEWIVVQNCYFHDYYNVDPNSPNAGTATNVDGLGTDNAANGAVFNCYFENWNGDAIDWSYGGYTDSGGNTEYYDYIPSYQSVPYTSRIERCIFDNCYDSKFEGSGPSSSINNYIRPVMFFTNNIYNNTQLEDYHWGFDAYRVHETYYFDDNYQANYPSNPKMAQKWFLYNFHDLGYTTPCWRSFATSA